ncbi:MAG: glycosyltransferase [Nitrospinae bacterium]|nr:glycosyltransferase [Nitrospinota bacterium]
MIKPEVSVVLITWNRREELLTTIKKIYESDYKNFEVIVADNNSHDGTVDAIKKEYSEVNLIALEENIGIGAYNQCFQTAQGKYILILDDDSYPEQEAMGKMVKVFDNEPKTGIIAFNIINTVTGKPCDFWHIPTLKGSVKWVNFLGCGAGIRTELLKKVGGYPEEFFIYENELDVSLKVLNEGYTITFNSEIIAFHPFTQEKRGNERVIYYGTKNKLLLLWKYFSLETVFVLTLKFVIINLFLTLKRGRGLLRLRAFKDAFKQYSSYAKKNKVTRGIDSDTRKKLAPFFNEFCLRTWLKRM